VFSNRVVFLLLWDRIELSTCLLDRLAWIQPFALAPSSSLEHFRRFFRMASACDFPPPTWLFGKKEELMAAKGKFAAMRCVNFNVGGDHAWWESNFFSV
jgi:hypothetical protein